MNCIPQVCNMEILPKESTQFFKHVVLDTMKNRDENNTFRPDMIQILLEAKKGKNVQSDCINYLA